MNLSDVYRDNAEDCAFLAERAEDGEVKRTLKRMEEAWRTLAQEQEKLALQLQFFLEMGPARVGLMSPAPGGPSK
jgi:hypothetical protein